MSEQITSTQQMTVGQISRRSGVPVSTLHFYESKGLLKPTRTAANQRLYSRGMLRRIAIIKVAQKAGVPLATIQRALASLPENRAPTHEDWRKLSTRWRTELDSRIKKLTQLRDRLDDCIGCGCLSLDRCQLSNPGDRASRLGPGPRYWIGDRPLNEAPAAAPG